MEAKGGHSGARRTGNAPSKGEDRSSGLLKTKRRWTRATPNSVFFLLRSASGCFDVKLGLGAVPLEIHQVQKVAGRPRIAQRPVMRLESDPV